MAIGSSGAITMAMLTALEEAYASGALSVRYSDRMVTYGSREDMEARILYLKRELGLITSANVPPVRYAQFRRTGDE